MVPQLTQKRKVILVKYEELFKAKFVSKCTNLFVYQFSMLSVTEAPMNKTPIHHRATQIHTGQTNMYTLTHKGYLGQAISITCLILLICGSIKRNSIFKGAYQTVHHLLIEGFKAISSSFYLVLIDKLSILGLCTYTLLWYTRTTVLQCCKRIGEGTLYVALMHVISIPTV